MCESRQQSIAVSASMLGKSCTNGGSCAAAASAACTAEFVLAKPRSMCSSYFDCSTKHGLSHHSHPLLAHLVLCIVTSLTTSSCHPFAPAGWQPSTAAAAASAGARVKLAATSFASRKSSTIATGTLSSTWETQLGPPATQEQGEWSFGRVQQLCNVMLHDVVICHVVLCSDMSCHADVA
jgi:hypothetical protein